jgi:microcin C transport system substrate-binding protein
MGIKNPAVDAMIEKIIYAKTREELVAAARALDRVLLGNQLAVPQWSYSKLRPARWNRFSHPATMPKDGMSAFPAVWWWDGDKAAKTGGKRPL